jgi:endonuclease YncB( thermonuclease family)
MRLASPDNRNKILEMESRRHLARSLLAILIVAAPAPAARPENFQGPVAASILRVLDGDTFEAEASVWPGQTVRVNVRIRGIDAPEMKSRCAAEHRAALRARALLERLLGPQVSISNIGGAKYYGRVLADVETPDGVPVVAVMLANGLARPYAGGRRRSWCG